MELIRAERLTRGRILSTLVVVATIAVGAALAIGGSSAHAQNPKVAGGPVIGAPQAPITSVTPADASAIGLLRRSVTASDAVPAAVVSGSSNAGTTAAYGLNFGLARQADGLADGQAWLVPGDAALCFVVKGNVDGVEDANGGEACSSDPSANDGRMAAVAMSQRAPGWLLVAGVVPDGVSSVTVHLADGTTSQVAVSDNVYLTEIQSSTIPEVTFSDAAGTVVPIPAGPMPGATGTSVAPTG